MNKTEITNNSLIAGFVLTFIILITIVLGRAVFSMGFRLDYQKAAIIFAIIIGIITISIGVWLGCQSGTCNFSPGLQITVVVVILLVILGILGGVGYKYGTPIKNTLIGPNPYDKKGQARMDKVGEANDAARKASAGIADPAAALDVLTSTYNKFLDDASNKAFTDAKNVRNSRIIPRVVAPLVIIIFFLIFIFFYVIFNVNSPFLNPNTGESSGSSGYYTAAAKNLFIVIFVISIILGIVFYLNGNQSLADMNQQIYNVKYIVFYILALILFFSFTPPDIINNYAAIILPVSVLFAIFIFYISSLQKVTKNFSFSYERIKGIILLFSLITILIIYNVINPGNYISEYLGYSVNITIAIATFALLYLMLLFKFQKSSPIAKDAKSNNFLSNFSSISSIGSILFLVFKTIYYFKQCLILFLLPNIEIIILIKL